MPHHVTGKVDAHRRQCATSTRHNDSDNRVVPRQSWHTTTTTCHVEDKNTQSQQCATSTVTTRHDNNGALPCQRWPTKTTRHNDNGNQLEMCLHLELLVSFFIFISYYFFCTNYSEMALVATATAEGVQDMTHLTPLPCFFFFKI